MMCSEGRNPSRVGEALPDGTMTCEELPRASGQNIPIWDIFQAHWNISQIDDQL